ncbi:hypothetical protein A4A49_07929 [Nicotiana attenuata]|uniref:Uncharacterized protein n=1 Tax=Nicotiana attenuata TaxID=49451 RepID=A0A1J6J6Q2_NICAT|nr:hypothetical protein A4A49_07929 [Nicotiana attenuata]
MFNDLFQVATGNGMLSMSLGRSLGVRKERNSSHGNGHSPSPRRETAGPENGHESSPLERVSPDCGTNPDSSKGEEREM